MKHKTKNKLLAALLALAFVFILMPARAQAAAQPPKCGECGKPMVLDENFEHGTYHLWECKKHTGSIMYTYEKHKGGTATCVSGAICETCGWEYTDKDPNNHDWDGWVIDGDNHYRVCKRGCGARYGEGTHSYDWAYVDDSAHRGVCVCGKEITEEHTYSSGGVCDICNGHCRHSSLSDSYAHDPDWHWKTCTYCNNIVTHEEHTWQDNWTSDGTQHWHECTVCKRKKDVAAHNGSNWSSVDGDNHAGVCDECGAKITEKHDWGSWVNDGDNHYRVCNRDGCGARYGEGTHDFYWSPVDGSNTHAGVCGVCGTEIREEHIWGSWAPVNGSNTHRSVCGVCGVEITEEHVWHPWSPVDGNTHEHLCVDCGDRIREAHEWDDWKTTMEPEIGKAGERQHACLHCGKVETEPIEALIGYTVTGGAGGSWTKGSGASFTITVKRSEADDTCIIHYRETLIDGNAVTVSAKPGSTVITIGADTLEKLSTGTHTVTVIFDDGQVTADLTIRASSGNTNVPQTGDGSRLAVWTSILLLSSAAYLVLFMFERKRRRTAE